MREGSAAPSTLSRVSQPFEEVPPAAAGDTEEIDALQTMGIDPVEFVLAPKFLAAFIMLPCLTVVSTACGILAGGAFMRITTGTAFGVYISGVIHAIATRDVVTGLVKSLAFAAIIANVGSLEGLRVRGGPDAVGEGNLTVIADVIEASSDCEEFLKVIADARMHLAAGTFGEFYRDFIANYIPSQKVLAARKAAESGER